ncbi:MAG TPA: hypothetical protein DD640_06220 [Clostridiales bacterium]|nr:hypothetical protein [Clostridiales bacterium]
MVKSIRNTGLLAGTGKEKRIGMANRQEPLIIEQLAGQTAPSEWIRGKSYYRNERVGSLSAAEKPSGEWVVHAEVHAAQAYAGRLLLSPARDRLLDWQCSCPQDQIKPCRHIIAILLQYLLASRSPCLHGILTAPAQREAAADGKIRTEVHILFRYQKQTDRILILPRMLKYNASGQKVMSMNPLDSENAVVSSQVTDRMALLRDRSEAQAVVDFFLQWGYRRQDPVGCLAFDADCDLPLLIRQVLPAMPATWRVLYDSEFEKIIPSRKTITADFTNLRPTSSGLLSFDLQFHCDRLSLDLKQLQDYAAGQQKWLLVNGRLIEAVNKEQLGRLLERLARMRQTAADNGMYEAEPSLLADMVSSDFPAAAGPGEAHISFDATFAAFQTGLAAILGGQTISGALADSSGRTEPIPERLDRILRPYQRRGVQWLLFLGRFHLGGILADEMGLGKTLQVLTALASGRRTKPALIICPKTLLFNWQNEARRFVPSLKTVLVHGAQDYRRRLLRQAGDFDLLITSYPLVQRDIAQYARLEFDCCIIDEAQMIKNPETHLARHVKKIKARQRIALTGTPMENRILDLWSIFDFALPGYLGKKDAFQIQYEQADRDRLVRKIVPFLLRRTKRDVLPELPEKIEETLYAPLTQNQLSLYQQTLAQIRSCIEAEIARQGLDRSRMAILAGLTRLRQICNHPGLLHDAYRSVQGISGKLELFGDLLHSLLADGHKILVFSQFTQMLAILSRRLLEQQIPFCYLDGQTQDRQQVIQRFNADPELLVFLISLKAGGFGLNLTAADTVILFDPWWNPMVEDQAADRVHRIGQKKVVTVYRLISQGTIEEKMENLQERKRQEFDQVVNRSGSQEDLPLSLEDLKALLDNE